MKERIKRPLFAKADVIIILFVALLALASIFFSIKSAEPPSCAVVKISGAEFGSYPLNKPGEYKIKGENGIELTLVVESDGVSVKNAECPDKLCEKTGKITSAGQSIVCLPAKVSIALEGNSVQPDAVVG